MPIETMLAGNVIKRGNTGEVVRLIQEALRKDGQELLADGDFGTITFEAVRRFQATHHLDPDGEVGPLTAKALDIVAASGVQVPAPLPSAMTVAPWLSVMRAISGTKEIPGPGDSPIIMSWAKFIADTFPDMRSYSLGYVHDSIPWCGETVAYCFAKCGLRPPYGPAATGRYMWAASWGIETEHLKRLERPVFGAVLVFTRAGGGHVGLYESEDATHFHVRGGNQSDMVKMSRVAKAQFTVSTWPRSIPIGNAQPIYRPASAYASSDDTLA